MGQELEGLEALEEIAAQHDVHADVGTRSPAGSKQRGRFPMRGKTALARKLGGLSRRKSRPVSLAKVGGD
jgi:hypothetical protein